MSNTQETFDAQAEVKRIRSLRAETRRKLFRKSRLDRYRAELVAMKQVGASCADLALWLRITHRCKINRSSIDRYLKKLPELRDDSHSNEEKIILLNGPDQERALQRLLNSIDDPDL